MSGRSSCPAWSLIATLPLVVQAAALASGPPARDTGATTAASSTSPAVDISDHVVRKAIADSKEPMDDAARGGRGSFGAGGATAQQRIDRRFQEAETPTCLTPDAFKFDPPTLGPIGVGGILALPTWVHAIATGRCRG